MHHVLCHVQCVQQYVLAGVVDACVPVLVVIHHSYACLVVPIKNLRLASQSCKELSQSKTFVHVMEYTLSVGNYLNANTPRGQTNGFKLVTLTKVTAPHNSRRQKLSLVIHPSTLSAN